jgi:hypothetical protein
MTGFPVSHSRVKQLTRPIECDGLPSSFLRRDYSTERQPKTREYYSLPLGVELAQNIIKSHQKCKRNILRR